MLDKVGLVGYNETHIEHVEIYKVRHKYKLFSIGEKEKFISGG